MKTLHAQLKQSLRILEHRLMMIPRYADQSQTWHGKNHYKLEDMPKVREQIEEMKAAIAGIEAWRKAGKPSTTNEPKFIIQ